MQRTCMRHGAASRTSEEITEACPILIISTTPSRTWEALKSCRKRSQKYLDSDRPCHKLYMDVSAHSQTILSKWAPRISSTATSLNPITPVPSKPSGSPLNRRNKHPISRPHAGRKPPQGQRSHVATQDSTEVVTHTNNNDNRHSSITQ